MNTIDIKGKPYVMVNERLKFFRVNNIDWSLTSEITHLENGLVVIKATVTDNKGVIRATGHAYEKEGKGNINKDSYIENCETSAWGRALGNLGIGIDTSIASADELLNTTIIPKAETQERFLDLVKKLGTADNVYDAIGMDKKTVSKIFSNGSVEDYELLNDAMFSAEVSE